MTSDKGRSAGWWGARERFELAPNRRIRRMVGAADGSGPPPCRRSHSLRPRSKGDGEVVKVDVEECTGCEACVEVCPVEAISMKDDKAVIDPETCTECETCVPECPVEAIKVE